VKILHIISSVNPAGGGPIEGIRQLGTTLEGQGHNVEIASLDAPNAPYLAEAPLRVHPLGPGTLRYGYSSRFVPWLRSNASRYDAVIVNGIWQYHSFGAWLALRRSSTPYVLFTHGMLDPYFKKQFPLKHLKKSMYWPWAEYRVLRDAHAVLFTCEEERLLARKSFWLYRCNEMVVNFGTAGITSDPEGEKEAFFGGFPELRGKKLALFVGRIHPKKSCDLVIQAFEKILAKDKSDDWHLLFVGPDGIGWRRDLSLLAERLGVSSRITWTGMIPEVMKWGALRSSEFFFFPSHMENFGIVVAEALSAGLPTLISNQVNIWREIEADGAGLVRPDNLEGACSLLRSYLDLPAKKRLAMRRAARVCFEKRFEIEKAADSLNAVLASATATVLPCLAVHSTEAFSKALTHDSLDDSLAARGEASENARGS
jgi:glycosyltransferase involved in cell wall biosynthesis